VRQERKQRQRAFGVGPAAQLRRQQQIARHAHPLPHGEGDADLGRAQPARGEPERPERQRDAEAAEQRSIEQRQAHTDRQPGRKAHRASARESARRDRRRRL
jgi:hypothetical protein